MIAIDNQGVASYVNGDIHRILNSFKVAVVLTEKLPCQVNIREIQLGLSVIRKVFHMVKSSHFQFIRSNNNFHISHLFKLLQTANF